MDSIIIQQIRNILKISSKFPIKGDLLYNYKNEKKAISKRYTIKHHYGYYKMILRTWLIGAVLPPCGQITVTK